MDIFDYIRDVVRAPEPAEQEARELLCMICGKEHPVWFAPNDLWNRVMRREDGSDLYPFVCPTCFAVEAERQGYATMFELRVAPAEQEGPVHTGIQSDGTRAFVVTDGCYFRASWSNAGWDEKDALDFSARVNDFLARPQPSTETGEEFTQADVDVVTWASRGGNREAFGREMDMLADLARRLRARLSQTQEQDE